MEEPGGLFAMITGTRMMPTWCAGRLAVAVLCQRTTGHTLDKGQGKSGWTTSVAEAAKLQLLNVVLEGLEPITAITERMLV